ncbi:MAG: GAF domain-containing protein [Planctomycetota bacterium]|nr:MAG: GAF domain-containing protein [Planctomycetota bacterium]
MYTIKSVAIRGLVVSTNFSEILDAVRRIVAGKGDDWGRLKAVCDLLYERVEYYDWVGFYIVEEGGKVLALGPYRGKPTGHMKIEAGRGVCGRVAQSRKPVVIDDVSKEKNYLACDDDVRSEIVMPVFKAGELVAELDIDSKRVSAFGEEDLQFLRQVAALVAPLF